MMNERRAWFPVIIRNLFGLTALLLLHYASDRYYFNIRTGFRQVSPYFFLLGLYGWIVFHNRVLFDRLYLKGKTGTYLFWMFFSLTLSSINLGIILIFVFNTPDVLPHVISFWLYTFAGLGVFVVFKYLKRDAEILEQSKGLPTVPPDTRYFECVIDGMSRQIPLEVILYLESYENYVKVFTSKESLLTRLPMKEAEERLPKSIFVRISRSHIVNARKIVVDANDSVKINGTTLKIGKVYKHYAAERFQAINING